MLIGIANATLWVALLLLFEKRGQQLKPILFSFCIVFLALNWPTFHYHQITFFSRRKKSLLLPVCNI